VRIWHALTALVFGLVAAAAPLGVAGRGAGEVVVRLEKVAGSALQEGVASGMIEAPPERVFAALKDFAHYREFMPFVAHSDAAPQPDGSVLSAQSLALPFPLGERHYTVRAVAAVEAKAAGRLWRLSWSYLPGSGNIVAHHGSWSLAAFGGGTLATCRLYTDPGGVPAWAMNRVTARSLGWIFKGLRQQVMRPRYAVP